MKKIYKMITSIIIVYLLLECKDVYANELNIQSRSAILIDKKTGRVLFEKNSREKVKVASLTKMMTAIVAIENANIEDIVQIGKGPAYIGGSTVGLKYQSEIKLETLLYGMLIKSGNDCALAIAEHIAGSKEKFADLMNQKAEEIGAKDSYFTNPHGLDDGENCSTAHDMALIAKYAASNKYIAKIIGTKSINLDFGGVNKYLSNTNRLLRNYEYCIGGKTGFTNGGNRCLIAIAKDQNMEVIAVVLGAPSTDIRFNEGQQLLEYGLEEYRYMDISDYMKFYINIEVYKGDIESYTRKISRKIILPLKADELEEIYIKQNIVPMVKAPLKSGAYLGNIEMYIANEKIYNEDIILSKDIHKKDVISYMEEGLKNIFNIELELY